MAVVYIKNYSANVPLLAALLALREFVSSPNFVVSLFKQKLCFVRWFVQRALAAVSRLASPDVSVASLCRILILLKCLTTTESPTAAPFVKHLQLLTSCAIIQIIFEPACDQLGCRLCILEFVQSLTV